jgi:hypothetical protein
MALKQGQCPSCGKGRLRKDLASRTMIYHGHTISYQVPGATCRNCGQRFIAPSGAAVAGDQVRAQEAAIDAREKRAGRKPPRVTYQSQEAFFAQVARDVRKVRAGKVKRPIVTVSADPSWHPQKQRTAERKLSRKS